MCGGTGRALRVGDGEDDRVRPGLLIGVRCGWAAGDPAVAEVPGIAGDRAPRGLRTTAVGRAGHHGAGDRERRDGWLPLWWADTEVGTHVLGGRVAGVPEVWEPEQ